MKRRHHQLKDNNNSIMTKGIEHLQNQAALIHLITNLPVQRDCKVTGEGGHAGGTTEEGVMDHGREDPVETEGGEGGGSLGMEVKTGGATETDQIAMTVMYDMAVRIGIIGAISMFHDLPVVRVTLDILVKIGDGQTETGLIFVKEVMKEGVDEDTKGGIVQKGGKMTKDRIGNLTSDKIGILTRDRTGNLNSDKIGNLTDKTEDITHKLLKLMIGRDPAILSNLLKKE